jgi:hypothetical protein
MTLELKTIEFNHNKSSASNSAMNIRRNKDYEVLTPEYDVGKMTKPKNFCAAYAIAETANQKVVIRVKFSNLSSVIKTYEVQATGGGIMGKLDPILVAFSGTKEVTVNIPLSHRTFQKVGRHDITWEWKYREVGSAQWLKLAITTHRIYLVLAIPPLPWTQKFADKRNPWTDLLDECCVIAEGSTNTDMAIKTIVKKIYTAYKLRYDIMKGEDRYTPTAGGKYWSFRLTKWIDYVLHGNAPNLSGDGGSFCPDTSEVYKWFLIVNCFDCAASLSLMAKVVGVPADYYFHNKFGYLNYVEPIGRGKCNNPFYKCESKNAIKPQTAISPNRTYFGCHAYTKLSGKCYDACMKRWGLVSWVWAGTSKLLYYGKTMMQTIFGKKSHPPPQPKWAISSADGWLVDLNQTDYDKMVIDASNSAKKKQSGGTPVKHTLNIEIT